MSRDISKIPRQTLTTRKQREALAQKQETKAKPKKAAVINETEKEEGGDARQS